MRKAFSLALLASMLFMLTAGARQPDQQGGPAQDRAAPWKLTTEDRIAKRAEAFTRYEADIKNNARSAESKSDAWLSGQEHPELFFPWEALVYLSVTAYDDDPATRQADRARFAERSDGFVDGEEFWTRLGNAIGPYLASGEEARSATPQFLAMSDATKRDAALKELDLKRCRARGLSLENAYAMFGRDAFDRFLYSAVVPSMNVFGDNPDASHLVYLQRGCP